MDGAIIALATVSAGIGWMIYEDRNRPPPPSPQVAYVPPAVPQSRKAAKQRGFDFPALFQIGVDLMNNGQTTTSRRKPSPDFGTGSRAGTPPRVGNLETNLLGLIGSIEAPAGYDQVYGGSRIATRKPLTQMTVAEVLAWQDSSVRAGSASSAAGRYQVLRKTLRSLVASGTVRMSDRYDVATQDRVGVALLERRGLKSYKSGSITAKEFGQRLSQEWASLPAMTRDQRGRNAAGQSYYAGDGLNKSLVPIQRVMDTISGGWA